MLQLTEVKRAGGQASIGKIIPPLGEGLRERVNLEDRLLKLTEVKRTGGQAIFIYSYLGKTGTKFVIDNSFASMRLRF